MPYFRASSDVWIGLKRTSFISGFVWENGETLTYNKAWDIGHPTDDENCVMAKKGDDFRLWRSEACESKKGFVCTGMSVVQGIVIDTMK